MRGVFCYAKKYIFGCLVLLSIVCWFIVFSEQTYALSSDTLIHLTNLERQNHGLDPLKSNEMLGSAAHAKASDMESVDYWEHTSPEGVEPWSFIRSSGYEYQYAGENLAKDFVSDEAIVRAWMNSPAHRANILSENFTEIGIAIMNVELLGEETNLVVAHYAKPAFTISNVVKAHSPSDKVTAYLLQVKDALRNIWTLLVKLFEADQLFRLSILNYSIFERR